MKARQDHAAPRCVWQSRAHPLWRICAVLLLPLFLQGLLEIHHHGCFMSERASLEKEAGFAPTAPDNSEDCAACLTDLNVRGLLLPPPLVLAITGDGSPLPAATDRDATELWLTWTSDRAPPFA